MSNYSNNGDIKEYCAHIRTRAQKITEALYRVTDLFPEEEPLKWLLRKEGVDILNRVIVLESASPHARIRDLEAASQLIPRILCVLELASSGTLISNLNFEVMRREYSSLYDFIKSKKEDLIPQPTGFLSSPSESQSDSIKDTSDTDSMTDTDMEAIEQHGNNGQQANADKAEIEIKEIKNEGAKDAVREISKINNANNEIGGANNNNDNNKEDNADKEKAVSAISGNGGSESRPYRQKKILEFVRNSGWVGVGDVSSIFGEGVSEKTIQRDLVSMADAGMLRMAGDKRWRRYSV